MVWCVVLEWVVGVSCGYCGCERYLFDWPYTSLQPVHKHANITNTRRSHGVAIYCSSCEVVVIHNCDFARLSGTSIGAVRLFSPDLGVVLNTTFRENYAQLYGGGMGISSGDSLIVVGCVFDSNSGGKRELRWDRCHFEDVWVVCGYLDCTLYEST